MTLDEILEILENHRRYGVTPHKDDTYIRAQNDLLDFLIEDFTESFRA
jgi:hypothetical protein